jgi:hypothetical protein
LEDEEQMNSKTCITFVTGPKVYEHQLEYSDIHRAIRLDGQQVLFFSEVEYQLFMLLVEYHTKEHKEVSYQEIASRIFACHINEDLLPQLRRRMSAIRKKISPFAIDLINIPNRGYELRSMHDLIFPYKRGHRAHFSGQSSAKNTAPEPSWREPYVRHGSKKFDNVVPRRYNGIDDSLLPSSARA